MYVQWKELSESDRESMIRESAPYFAGYLANEFTSCEDLIDRIVKLGGLKVDEKSLLAAVQDRFKHFFGDITQIREIVDDVLIFLVRHAVDDMVYNALLERDAKSVCQFDRIEAIVKEELKCLIDKNRRREEWSAKQLVFVRARARQLVAAASEAVLQDLHYI